MTRAGLALALALAACAPPERGACRPHPEPGELGTICGFDRAEDLALASDADLVLGSSMRSGGGLYAIAVEELEAVEPHPWRIWPPASEPVAAPPRREGPVGAPECSAAPEPALFYSHGLGVLASEGGTPVRVAVVSHAPREAIELFDLHGRGRGAALVWRGCVPLPDGTLGNDVAVAPDGELVVTDFVPRRSGIAQQLELYRAALGFDTGSVLAWRADRGWRSVEGTRGAGPNGVLLSPDGREIYFAENGRRRVVRVPRSGASDREPPRYADVGGHPDNISWVEGGEILAIVHTGGPEALLQPCLLDWALWSIDPATLAAHERLRHDGTQLCGATSATKIGERILIGSMSETRIGVWSPAPPVEGTR